MKLSLQHTTSQEGIQGIRKSGAIKATRQQEHPTVGMTTQTHVYSKEHDFFVFCYLVTTHRTLAPVADHQAGDTCNPAIISLDSKEVFRTHPDAIVRVYCNSFLLMSSLTPAVRLGELTLQAQFQCYANPLDSTMTYTLSHKEKVVWQYTEQARQAQFSVKELRQHLFIRLCRILAVATGHDPSLEAELVKNLQGEAATDYVAKLMREILGPIEVLIPRQVLLTADVVIATCTDSVYRSYQEVAQKMIEAIAKNDTKIYKLQLSVLVKILKKHPQLIYSSITLPGRSTSFDLIATLISDSRSSDKNCLSILQYILQKLGRHYINVNQVLCLLSEQNIARGAHGQSLLALQATILKQCEAVTSNRLTTNYLLLALQQQKPQTAEWLMALGTNPYPHCVPHFLRTGESDTSAYDLAKMRNLKLFKDWPKPTTAKPTSVVGLANLPSTLQEINFLAKLLTDWGMRVSFDGETLIFHCAVTQTSQRHDHVNSTMLLTIPQALGAPFAFIDTRQFVAEEFNLDCYRVTLNNNTQHAPPYMQHHIFTSIEEVRDQLVARYMTRLLITAQNTHHQQRYGKPHPHTSKGSGSAKVLLHPAPLTGFTVSVRCLKNCICINVKNNNGHQHLKLTHEYLSYMLPAYAAGICIVDGQIHITGITLVTLCEQQLQQ